MDVIKVDEVMAGNTSLIARSQSKSLLTNIGSQNVVFDFSGIESIGQAFADEIFRVYNNHHPDITITYCNAVKDVEKMIKRANS